MSSQYDSRVVNYDGKVLYKIGHRSDKIRHVGGGSPGLVVMGDNSCSRGNGFESWRRILDGHL